MALSARVRFEVFKRDDFTCRYCGRRSPEVILEVDHIVPTCDGGTDDLINLTTSCWDCNRGKGGVPLGSVMTGEDPHDRAIEILERRRQLDEYNHILKTEREQLEATAWEIWRYWQRERGRPSVDDLNRMPKRDLTWLMNTLTTVPATKLYDFMDAALVVGATRDFRYVTGCVRNWREQEQARREDADDGAARDDFYAEYQEYLRTIAVEEVLLQVREAETARRNRGGCNHKTPCSTFSDCVQREVRIRLGVPPSTGAPSRWL